MATVTINISRAKVYSIAEGISITISQHNGVTPTYEQLWASESESKKLDIYYREAVGDLEHRLMEWAKAVSAQFDLSADGADYTLQLEMSRYWPARLEGLLDNKIQDYLVHAVTAGWLRDFDGVKATQDYQELANLDIADIRTIIYQRAFDFDTAARETDNDNKDTSGHDASARETDNDNKDTSGHDASARGKDDGKDMFVLPLQAGFRGKDDVVKKGPDDKPFICRERTDRHKDNDTVCPRTDWTDMSGTGIAYRDRICEKVTRPMMGRGYTPQPEHRPCDTPCPPAPGRPDRPVCGCGIPANCPPPPPEDPRKEPKVYPEPPYHAIPPKYPPFPPLPEVTPNGIDWSDMDHYDQENEERFINSHECGQHDCEGDMFDFDDDENDEINQQ